MPKSKTYNKVLKEVSAAYIDCSGMPFEEACNKRNLQFKASAAVSVKDAIEIFNKSGVKGYNEFEPNLLKALPPKAKVTIAREGSVCIYVKSKDQVSSIGADEFDEVKPNVWRIWWD